ncbi:MAG: F0F1 ATP synthase subunit delta, partial [Selenomonadaceae bacterium]|nr:F0F1 ATP synthase subunit delta [Selenomonadaceae bacterium]
AALEEKLGEKYEVNVELECVVDESLIGGVRVEIL